jgi:hypothetical protein
VAADGTTHLTWTGGTLQTGYLLFELGQPEPGLTVLAANQQAHTLGPPLAALSCYLLAPIVEVDPPAVSDLLCALRGVQVGFTPASLGIGLGGTSLASLSWPATSGQQGYLLLPLGSAPLPLDASATGATQPISAPTCFVLAPLVAGQVLGVTNGVCAIPGVGTLSGARDSIARGRAGL